MYLNKFIHVISILSRSRSATAREHTPTDFNLEESKSNVESTLSSKSPHQIDDVEASLGHCEQILKHYRMKLDKSGEKDSDTKKLIVDYEYKRALLLSNCYLSLLLADVPSAEMKSSVMKARKKSKRKDNEKKIDMDLCTWNTTVVGALGSLERSIKEVERSGLYSAEISVLRQAHDQQFIPVHEATKSVGVNSNFHLSQFMAERFSHEDEVTATDELLEAETSPIQSVAILQKKARHINDALEKGPFPVEQREKLAEKYVKDWAKHEAEHERIDICYKCVDGLYVDKQGRRVSKGTKGAIMVVPPGGFWLPNKMSCVVITGTIIIVKHWHPPSEGGVVDWKNGCLICMSHLGPSVVHSEGGGEMTPELCQEVISNMVIYDKLDMFPYTKEHVHLEFDTCAELMYGKYISPNETTTSKVLFRLRGSYRIQAKLVLNFLCGKTSRVGVFSAEVSKTDYQLAGAGCASNGDMVAEHLTHGQAQSTPDKMMTEKTHSMEELNKQSRALAGILWSKLSSIYASSTSKSMVHIAKRSGEEILSPEARAMYEAHMHHQLSLNSQKAYKTCILKKVGLPKHYLDLCIANNIEGATIENATSLYMSWLWHEEKNHPLHRYLYSQSPEAIEKRSNASKQAYKTCIEKKVGLPKHYLDLCIANNIEGATIDNAQSLYMSWLNHCENEVDDSLYRYLYSQSPEAIEKRSNASKQGHKTCIEKGVGCPAYYLDLCKTNNIEGATIENAQSLYQSWEVSSIANKIKSEEDAKLDDLKYLAISLEPYCDINNLHKDMLTRDLFTDTNAQAVFDRVFESYNDNKDLLKTKLINATPKIASAARNWSTFTAECSGKIGLNIDDEQDQIYINCVSPVGPFADTEWEDCTIMFINGRRYTTYEDGMILLAAAKNTGTITLTVKQGSG